MGRNRDLPEINSGSMADIAFLLLIFFLVATTVQTDLGLIRKLPPEKPSPPISIHERNVLRLILNRENKLLVDGELMKIQDLETAVVDFLDNGFEKEICSYCLGKQSKNLSDSPKEAIISWQSDRKAAYGSYMQVHDMISKAFSRLRDREAMRLYGRNFSDMEKEYTSPGTTQIEKRGLRDKIKMVREMFPMQISESQLIVKS